MTESAQPTSATEDTPHLNGDNSLRALCTALHARVEAFLQEDVQTERLKRVQAQIRISLGVIHEALQRYSLSALSLSYNGGKDCLVLLILYLSALATHPSLPSRLESIYIVPPHPFPQVDSFVASSATTYHLMLNRLKCAHMKAAFADYLSLNPAIEAIFVGTRRTDPHGGSLTHFDMTDHGWPLFMRIHPVIDWHYAEIWDFIRHLGVEYCELYDMGYTSLGGTTDTHPNPALKVGQGVFRPAYELEEDEEERLGRDW